jgi:hypothetical protein
MNDRQLRCCLNEYNILTGPIISKRFFICFVSNEKNQGHTRAIYQHKLLEAISNAIKEGIFFKLEK